MSRKRLVLLHTIEGPTFEGVMTGRRAQFGRYRLEAAKVRESAERTTELDGVAEVPEARVFFVQVLAEGV